MVDHAFQVTDPIPEWDGGWWVLVRGQHTRRHGPFPPIPRPPSWPVTICSNGGLCALERWVDGPGAVPIASGSLPFRAGCHAWGNRSAPCR